jgi:hypothetical protein
VTARVKVGEGVAVENQLSTLESPIVSGLSTLRCTKAVTKSPRRDVIPVDGRRDGESLMLIPQKTCHFCQTGFTLGKH